MNLFDILTILSTSIVTIITMFMLWYNGILEVTVNDNDGDDVKLKINEYDNVRKKKFMILVIQRKK